MRGGFPADLGPAGLQGQESTVLKIVSGEGRREAGEKNGTS